MLYNLGQKIHKWTIIDIAPPRIRKTYWLCECECGIRREVRENALKSNMSKFCGYCKIKHGACVNYDREPEYCVWDAMIQRCSNVKCKGYKRYGGRGIKVCDEWRDYTRFINDMGRRPTPKHSLDRIDNDGGYNLTNCRWATRKEQDRNTSQITYITLNGARVKFIDACDQYSINPATARFRLRRGWSAEDTFHTPVQLRNNLK